MYAKLLGGKQDINVQKQAVCYLFINAIAT